MEPLKEIYDQQFLEELATSIQKEYASFQSNHFIENCKQADWEDLTLKERMRRISVTLHSYLPDTFEESLAYLYKVAPSFKGLKGIIFPDYVEQFGLMDWEKAVQALAFFTTYSSSEFAVRPFIIKDQNKMLEEMLNWASSENEHLRRLASEGCRPRLPWGMSIPSLKKDPLPILPILELLKEDDSLYVRKSVANNINDISKTHPELVIELVKRWYGENTKTNWIVKHGCRTLLKKGNMEVLPIFGYKEGESIALNNFKLNRETLSIGESMEISFNVHSPTTQKVRIEYIVDYAKANNKRSSKVFHLSDTILKEGEEKTYKKSHSFKDLTTRRHYPGLHTITVVINGQRKESIDLYVIKK